MCVGGEGGGGAMELFDICFFSHIKSVITPSSIKQTLEIF